MSAALDEALAALTSLDAERLEKIEGALSSSLAGGSELRASDGELQEIVARHRLLGTLLASTSLNLQILQRLHSRNSTGEIPGSFEAVPDCGYAARVGDQPGHGDDCLAHHEI